eukprot:COSAG06_NODE_52503_length_305_cov_0.757282_1_plen_94_part_10
MADDCEDEIVECMSTGKNASHCVTNSTKCMCIGEHGASPSAEPGACNASHTGPLCALCVGADDMEAIGGTDTMCYSCAHHRVTDWFGFVLAVIG